MRGNREFRNLLDVEVRRTRDQAAPGGVSEVHLHMPGNLGGAAEHDEAPEWFRSYQKDVRAKFGAIHDYMRRVEDKEEETEARACQRKAKAEQEGWDDAPPWRGVDPSVLSEGESEGDAIPWRTATSDARDQKRQ